MTAITSWHGRAFGSRCHSLTANYERPQITRDRNNQKLVCASGQTAANSLTQAINEARDRGDIELLERLAKDPQPNKAGGGAASPQAA